MYLIIVGAGPEGSRLVELALKDGHRVSIIEKDEKRAQAVLQNYGIAEGGILDEADADTADVLVATTSDDSANLMAMFLGKERGIKTLMSMVNDRHHQAILLLSLAMVVGGASGSTVGGLKLNRLVLLYKGVLWRFRRLSLQPHQLMRYKLNHQVFTEPEANRLVEGAAILAVLWVGLLAAGVLILLHLLQPQYALSDVIFEAASALGSVGLSTGISHPDLHWLGKLILILFMWMGRLEIIPVLILFSCLLGSFNKLMGRL